MGAALRKEHVYTVPEVVGILRTMTEPDVIDVLEQYRGAEVSKPKNREPFFHFADDAEVPLRRIRSELFACCEMLKLRGPIDEETQSAIAELNTTALCRIDDLIQAHGEAYDLARAA